MTTGEVVAFIGVIGSGKDHRKRELVAKGYAPLDFKDALLEMASDLVGYDVTASYDYFKENLVGLTAPAEIGPDFMRRRPPHQISAEVLAGYPQAMTGRRLLQRLGTEVMRKRDPDYWAKAWADKAYGLLREGKSVVCADCRFPNEVRWIRQVASDFAALRNLDSLPARFIFCDYRSHRYNPEMDHGSERLAQQLLALGFKDGEEVSGRI